MLQHHGNRGGQMAAASAARPRSGLAGRSTANARLKQSFATWSGGALALSAAIHLAVLSLGSLRIPQDFGERATPPLELIAVAPVELPPPPDMIIRPVVPVLSLELGAVDPTIPEIRFQTFRPPVLPPPPVPEVDVSEQPVFVPREVEPVLRNRREVAGFLEQHYPWRMLRFGQGGTAVFEALVDEQGTVQKTVRISSSGFPELDEVAERVFRIMRFSPAMKREEATAVWVRMPIRFVAR